MTDRHEVCPVSSLPPGERTIVEIGGISIGIFNVEGEFYALHNRCPHQQAPLCEGELTGVTTAAAVGEYDWEKDGEILTCPWHGWEFDVTTGRSFFNPHAVRTQTYDVETESSCQQSMVDSDRDDEDESVETYPVSVEEEMVVLYV